MLIKYCRAFRVVFIFWTGAITSDTRYTLDRSSVVWTNMIRMLKTTKINFFPPIGYACISTRRTFVKYVMCLTSQEGTIFEQYGFLSTLRTLSIRCSQCLICKCFRIESRNRIMIRVELCKRTLKRMVKQFGHVLGCLGHMSISTESPIQHLLFFNTSIQKLLHGRILFNIFDTFLIIFTPQFSPTQTIYPRRNFLHYFFGFYTETFKK